MQSRFYLLMPMIALVDINACFSSCEQIYRPDLRGKPVIVLSNNDGCVVARNKEAKALNIPGLVPYFTIRAFAERHHVHVFSSNYELYGDLSRRMMQLLASFGHAIEVYSIDEAFLDLSGVTDLVEQGQRIQRACWQQQRMPVCVGIGKTKTLAKLANHVAKKSRRLKGVCIIDAIQPWRKLFRQLPVNTLWGVGSRLSKQLQTLSIHSVQDFIEQPEKTIYQHFGVLLVQTHRELRGQPCLDLTLAPAAKKSIVCGRSFGTKVTDYQSIRESVAHYATRAAEKLRRQGSLVRRVAVTIQTSRFNHARYSNHASELLVTATNDSRDIITVATALVQGLYKPGYHYARAAVDLLDLVDETRYQPDLFSAGQSLQSRQLMRVIDALNQRYGQGTAFFAAQGIQRQWAMARHLKSPAYTTRFSDIPVVKL